MPATSKPGDDGRDEPERAQRAVAAADVGVAVEDAPEAARARELLQRRARVGDGDEVRAVHARARTPCTSTSARSSRRTSRRRSSGSCRGRGRRGTCAPRRGAWSPARAACRPPSCGPKDWRKTSGARLEPPMPSTIASRVALGDELVAQRLEVGQLLARALGDVQPAEPVGDLGRPLGRPQRPVLAPQAPDDVLVGGGAQAGGYGIGVAPGDVGFDRRDVAHARFLLQCRRIARDASERAGYKKCPCRPMTRTMTTVPSPERAAAQGPPRARTGCSACCSSSTSRPRFGLAVLHGTWLAALARRRRRLRRGLPAGAARPGRVLDPRVHRRRPGGLLGAVRAAGAAA